VEADQTTRQAEWEQQRTEQAGEVERRLGEQYQRHEAELHGLRAQYEAGRGQAQEEQETLKQELERLGNESRTSRDQATTLQQQHDEVVRHRDEIAAERDRITSERQDVQERLDAAKRALDEQAEAHRNDLAQLADEFDTLRRERDGMVGDLRDITRDRDRLAALHSSLTGSQQESEQALRAELSGLTEERDMLRQRALAADSRSADLSRQLDALRAELETARRQSEAALARTSSKATSGPGDSEKRLAEVQSQLKNAEESRTALADALKAAQNQIHDLTIDLEDAQREQGRIRSMLDNMGIHLL
jgi:chromosome segregation ATPase